MFEWLRKLRRPRPDWVINIPDGIGSTALVLYKGKMFPGVTHLALEMAASGAAILHLSIHPGYLEAALEVLNPQIDTVEGEALSPHTLWPTLEVLNLQIDTEKDKHGS